MIQLVVQVDGTHAGYPEWVLLLLWGLDSTASPAVDSANFRVEIGTPTTELTFEVKNLSRVKKIEIVQGHQVVRSIRLRERRTDDYDSVELLEALRSQVAP